MDKRSLAQHPDAAPRSAVNLGILLYQHESFDQAVPVFQLAIDSGHHEQSPKAYRNLAVLRRSEEDLEGAEEALRAAIASGHPEIAPSSLTLLGRLLGERGDTAGGISALREAVSYADFKNRPEAWLHLALLLERRRNIGCRRCLPRGDRLRRSSQHAVRLLPPRSHVGRERRSWWRDRRVQRGTGASTAGEFSHGRIQPCGIA